MVLYSYMERATGPTSPSLFLAACIALPIVCILTVGLRFNARRMQKSGFQLDDWTMVSALIFYIGLCVCGILGSSPTEPFPLS